MKIFLVGFHSKVGIEVAKKLAQNSIDIPYWIIGNYFKAEAKKYFPNTIFHHSYDALANKPAEGVDISNFMPPGADMIKKLSECESSLYTMMAKVNHTNVDIIKQQRLFHEYIKYWIGVLDIFKPNAIIFGDVPHFITTFVLYHLAKVLNIKTIIIKNARGIPGRLLFFNDIKNYASLNAEYAMAENKNVSFSNLSAEMQKYYQEFTKENVDATVIYQRTMNKKIESAKVFPGKKRILDNIKNFTLLKTIYYYLRMLFNWQRKASLEEKYYFGWQLIILKYLWNRKKNKFRKEYSSLVSDVDLQRDFIYVPLHFQPECNTNPMGGFFEDQILMIDILSSALPKGWKIYVKEHPTQWYATRAQTGRYKGYYRELLKIKNVHLVKIAIPAHAFIARARAVATVTGTSGWEALLKSKPVLLYGYVWYMGCQGVFNIQGVDDCKKALEKIADGYKPKKREIIKFLEAFEKISLKGYLESRFFIKELDWQDNIKNVTAKLLSELSAKS